MRLNDLYSVIQVFVCIVQSAVTGCSSRVSLSQCVCEKMSAASGIAISQLCASVSVCVCVISTCDTLTRLLTLFHNASPCILSTECFARVCIRVLLPRFVVKRMIYTTMSIPMHGCLYTLWGVQCLALALDSSYHERESIIWGSTTRHFQLIRQITRGSRIAQNAVRRLNKSNIIVLVIYVSNRNGYLHTQNALTLTMSMCTCTVWSRIHRTLLVEIQQLRGLPSPLSCSSSLRIVCTQHTKPHTSTFKAIPRSRSLDVRHTPIAVVVCASHALYTRSSAMRTQSQCTSTGSVNKTLQGCFNFFFANIFSKYQSLQKTSKINILTSAVCIQSHCTSTGSEENTFPKCFNTLFVNCTSKYNSYKIDFKSNIINVVRMHSHFTGTGSVKYTFLKCFIVSFANNIFKYCTSQNITKIIQITSSAVPIHYHHIGTGGVNMTFTKSFNSIIAKRIFEYKKMINRSKVTTIIKNVSEIHSHHMTKSYQIWVNLTRLTISHSQENSDNEKMASSTLTPTMDGLDVSDVDGPVPLAGDQFICMDNAVACGVVEDNSPQEHSSDVPLYTERSASKAPQQALSRNERKQAYKKALDSRLAPQKAEGKDSPEHASACAGLKNPSVFKSYVPNCALSIQTTGLKKDAPYGQSSDPNGRSDAPDNMQNKQAKSGMKKVHPKRQRSDDQPDHPSSKRPSVDAPNSDPAGAAHVEVARSPELEVVLDDISEVGQMLTMQQVDLIRFELASLVADQEQDAFAPTFELSRCSGASMHIYCINEDSVNWLLSKREAISSVIDGVKLRMRKRTDIPPSVRVCSFFPIPKDVVPAFVLRLLLRQNRHLDFSEWKIVKFEAVAGKDSS